MREKRAKANAFCRKCKENSAAGDGKFCAEHYCPPSILSDLKCGAHREWLLDCCFSQYLGDVPLDLSCQHSGQKQVQGGNDVFGHVRQHKLEHLADFSSGMSF